jgi:hypothetical protein
MGTDVRWTSDNYQYSILFLFSFFLLFILQNELTALFEAVRIPNSITDVAHSSGMTKYYTLQQTREAVSNWAVYLTDGLSAVVRRCGHRGHRTSLRSISMYGVTWIPNNGRSSWESDPCPYDISGWKGLRNMILLNWHEANKHAADRSS